MGKIQLFVPTYHVEECLDEIKECLEIGWTGLGFKTLRFEEEWKKYTGLPHAHFLNSSTAGLHLAIKLFKDDRHWEAGDEIITTPMTFVSSNHVILYENLTPVFADIDDTLCLDPSSIEKNITKKTRAVIYVGMGGNPGRLEQVMALCKNHGLILILDAAHMAGSKIDGKQAGQGIDCVVFSFHAVKNLPTADAGMICFDRSDMDNSVRKWSWLGIDNDTFVRMNNVDGNYRWYYDVPHVGFKYHGNSIMASIGLVQLKYLEGDNERRRQVSALYEERLSCDTRIRFIEHVANSVSSRHLFQIRVPHDVRDRLMAYLNTKDIFPGVHYRINTDYTMYAYGQHTCMKAEQASVELISLPMHLRLTDDQVNYVCDHILYYFKNLECL